MTRPTNAGHIFNPGQFSMKIPGQFSAKINTRWVRRWVRQKRGHRRTFERVGIEVWQIRQIGRLHQRASLTTRGSAWPRSYQPFDRFTIQTTDSMTGTSISTPTTVASAAPDWKPNRLMAAATASSKKLLRADQGRRAGDAMLLARNAVQQIGEAGIEIDLDQDRHRQQRDHKRLRQDLLALKAEQQHQCRQQRDERQRLQPVQQSLQRRLTTGREQPAPQELRDDHRHDDVEHDRQRQACPTAR